MPTIAEFTQTHMSLVLFTKTTGVILKNIPIYAEISITTEEPPYNIDKPIEFLENEASLRQWYTSRTYLLQWINEAIAASVTEGDFNNIPDKHAFYIDILEKIQGNWVNSEAEENKKRLVRDIVKDRLDHFQVPTSSQPNKITLYTYPLGTLASDQAGYLSYDLTHALARFKELTRSKEFVASSVAFKVYPLGKDDMVIDVSPQARFTPNVVFGKVQFDVPEEYHFLEAVKLPSMQDPSLEDWYLSPGSFAINPAFFIGVDGCENLYPANFATHEFRFFQILRSSKIIIPAETRDEESQVGNQVITKKILVKPEVRTGWSLEYLVSWQPLGHTLGQIIYSLPLAPGETRKMAVIDWARKSIDSRDEDLTVKEQLAHNTHRDRSVSETVDAALREWQRGGSFMGGVAGSYGGGGMGVSGALGGGYSTSSGDRNIHASTAQQISDAFAQASSAVRELRSTIVVQSDQQEQAKAETSVVANHNHSHTLTILYYEVLRHYKVTTQYMRFRPSLLVQYLPVDFLDTNIIYKYRKILESVLLDSRYAGCFDAVQKLVCFTLEFARKIAQAALQPDLNDVNELGPIKLVIKTKTATHRFPSVAVKTKSGERINCLEKDPLWASWIRSARTDFSLPDAVDDGTTNLVSANYRQAGQENVFNVEPFRKVLWNDIDGIILRVNSQDKGSSSGPSEPWEIEGVQIMTTSGDKVWIMARSADVINIPVDAEHLFTLIPYREIPKDPADLLTEAERCCINDLKSHLSANAFHYQKALWLLEDPNERAYRFKDVVSSGTSILDMIDNRAIDVLGDYVVFPARKSFQENEALNALQPIKVEKLMTLPTRGVFAEGKLGHCNISEEIDDIRFWDWQTSPITEEAPGIDNLNINESRNVSQNLTPTPMPASIVNIVTPQNLPDPTGMAGALNLLGKADIFRDMSVSKEVEDLLEKLADKSVDINQAAKKAKEIQQQHEASKNANTPVVVSQPAQQQPSQKTISPAEAQQQIKVSENQAVKGTITKQDNNENVKKAIQQMQGGKAGSDVTVTINFKHSISGPLDGVFNIEFIGPIGDSFTTSTAGGVGAGKVNIQTGAEYTIQIKGTRTRLPLSLDTIARIPSVAGNPAFNIDLSNHVTKREVPIEANIVATITKGRKAINITIVAEEVAKDIKITVKVTGSGTLKADLEGQLGLNLDGLDLGHIKAGTAVETTVGGEAAVELPVEFKRLTGNVTAPKNDLAL